MALGKHLVQAKLFVYALQFLTGNLNNNHQWFHLHVLYMYVNYVVWSTTLVAKAAEMVAKASIVLSNHYWCLNIDYWGPNNCTYLDITILQLLHLLYLVPVLKLMWQLTIQA